MGLSYNLADSPQRVGFFFEKSIELRYIIYMKLR